MNKKHRRYSLKSKEGKIILRQVSERLKTNLETLVGSKPNIEASESGMDRIFLVEGKPLLFKLGEDVFPTLLFNELLARLPKIVVDMGAVPYVCKGADIMAPGIVRIEGEFSAGDIVVVVDEKHGKPLALGESLHNSETARAANRGAVIKNYHFVSDRVWTFAKTLAQ